MNRIPLSLAIFLAGIISLTSCVSNKKLKACEDRYKNLSDQYVLLESSKKDCETQRDALTMSRNNLEKDNDFLKKQIDYLKANNDIALNQLRDMSVLSASQAESIKKSLDNIDAPCNESKRGIGQCQR